MKKYYVSYYKDFANTYNLMYVETAEDEAALPDNAQQITRKEAEALARKEREARKNDGSFSGYADGIIFPAAYDPTREDWQNSSKYELNGLILERV